MNFQKILIQSSNIAIPIELVDEKCYSDYLANQDSAIKTTLEFNKFKAKPNTFCAIYQANGQLKKVVVGYNSKPTIWSLGNLALSLPEADYCIENKEWSDIPLEIGWALGAYQFTRYKKPKRDPARLVIRTAQDIFNIQSMVETIFWIRDLINTPTEDMTPSILAREAEQLAKEYGANYRVIVGEQLLKQNFPTIHRVGRAAAEHSQPCLIELTWGNPRHKKIALVGKGVCFDTGGLDIKPSSGMLLMKKDMGGAAHALGLAKLIMAAKLPVHLQVLVPAVENSVAGNAMRPGDVVTTRKGLTVEIGNTDAEGRLILSDALAYACEQKPNLILDFATLTGAGRVALGPAIPAMLSNDKKLSAAIQSISELENDLVWGLPLYKEYRPYIDSAIADLNNNSKQPYGGCITAALFLSEFVNADIPWAHFDLMAYNVETLPGRPAGADAQGLRAAFHYIQSSLV